MTQLLTAGVDEAGRGALAGPVVAAAVIDSSKFLDLIQDSKKLTDTQRRECFLWIKEHCDYGIGVVEAEEIDKIGIKKATEKAMNMAVSKLTQKPEKLLVDGRDKFNFEISSEDIVRGDETEPCISAASIIAKVTRDDLMIELDKKHPTFNFLENKGYGTKPHYKLLDEGIYCDVHRKTYDPLKTWLNQGRLF